MGHDAKSQIGTLYGFGQALANAYPIEYEQCLGDDMDIQEDKTGTSASKYSQASKVSATRTITASEASQDSTMAPSNQSTRRHNLAQRKSEKEKAAKVATAGVVAARQAQAMLPWRVPAKLTKR